MRTRKRTSYTCSTTSPYYDNWCCPKCGGTEQWFDRTITLMEDGSEEGMTTRCVACGISTDEWVRRGDK